MIVICKTATKRLIKGNRYNAISIWNDGTSIKYYEGKIRIEGIGVYSIKNFICTDGTIPKIKFEVPFIKGDKFEDLKVGDILVCLTNRYSIFAKDQKYQIEKLLIREKEYTNYRGQKVISQEKKVKFVGINRPLIYNNYYFRKLADSERRDISLNSLLTGKETDIIKGIVKKIDLAENRDMMLMSVLCKSIIDSNRHCLSIIEWACQKLNNYGIEISDYDKLLEMSLKDILKKIEK